MVELGAEIIMEKLIGRKINHLFVSSGENFLKLDTDKGEMIVEAEGDCCSESWFADIINASLIFGKEITSVEEEDLPQPSDNRGRQESDAAYGIVIKTTGGQCNIVFRNSSNGYYGGWANFLDMSWESYVNNQYNDQTKERLRKITWKEITDDWSV